MLKSVMYYLLFLTTAVRVTDLIYLLAKENTNLPIPVIIVTSAMILYGVYLIVKKFVSNVWIKQLMVFYALQTCMIVFNLAYVSLFCPLRISWAETFVIGTFLDVIVNAGLLFAAVRQIRNSYYYRPIAHTSTVFGADK